MSQSRTLSNPKVALAVVAHPDDVEFLCAGTLIRLARAGWEVWLSTTCGGDLGAVSGSRESIRATRMQEAAAGARTLGAKGYLHAGLDDVQVYYNPENLLKVVNVLRRVKPDLVITHSPDCYMLDHEETSRLTRMAAFCAGIPLLDSGEPPLSKPVPHLYYADAMGVVDKYGRTIRGDFAIDIADVFEQRQRALECHDSQRSWLRSHHGIDQYLITNETQARTVGGLFGAELAESFRQHLAPPHPGNNLLAEELNEWLLR